VAAPGDALATAPFTVDETSATGCLESSPAFSAVLAGAVVAAAWLGWLLPDPEVLTDSCALAVAAGDAADTCALTAGADDLTTAVGFLESLPGFPAVLAGAVAATAWLAWLLAEPELLSVAWTLADTPDDPAVTWASAAVAVALCVGACCDEPLWFELSGETEMLTGAAEWASDPAEDVTVPTADVTVPTAADVTAATRVTGLDEVIWCTTAGTLTPFTAVEITLCTA
jgi:hypothetical protein